MAKERWSREYAACQGWDDQQGHHACGSPALPHNAGGRCVRCYALHRKALGQAPRDPFPSVNDELFPGDPRPDAGVVQVKEPAMVNGVTNADRDATKSLGRVTITKLSNGHEDEPNFEVFTIVGQVHESGPSLFLRADGRLSINVAAFRTLGEPSYVELLYDKARALVGVRQAAPSVLHARPVLGEKASPTVRYVNIRALLAYHGVSGCRITPGTTRQYGDVLAVALTVPESAKGR